MKLQGGVADLPLQLGMEQFGGRGLGCGQLALQVAGRAPVQVRPSGLQLGLQVGQGEAGILEVEDGLAEGLAVLGELHRLVKGPLGTGLARDGDLQPLLGQLGHQIDEALVLLAQKVAGRNPDVLEEELGGVG